MESLLEIQSSSNGGSSGGCSGGCSGGISVVLLLVLTVSVCCIGALIFNILNSLHQ